MIKVENAVILAAGRGSRLKELTQDTPKPLLAPRGVTFIEGIIKNLHEKGIKDIYVVTGYLAEKFEFLVKKYNVKLIHNNEWDKGNNVTSVKAALNVLGNSLIVNGDIIMKENVFWHEYPSSLTYVEKNKDIAEWIVNVDEKNNVKSFEKDGLGKSGFYQREIIFVSKELIDVVKNEIKSFNMQEYQEFLMLKSAHKSNIPFSILEIDKNIVFDLDNKEEYENYSKNE